MRPSKRKTKARELVNKRWKKSNTVSNVETETADSNCIETDEDESTHIETNNVESHFETDVVESNGTELDDVPVQIEKTPEKNLRIQTKMSAINSEKEQIDIEKECRYIFLDFTQLSPLLSKLQCTDCGKSLKLDLLNNDNGFCHDIVLRCNDCELQGLEGTKSQISSSKKAMKKKSRRPPFDINLRLSTAFLYIGKGYSAIEQFAMIMNMHPFSQSTFDKHAKILEESFTQSTNVIMNECRLLAQQAHADSQDVSEEILDNSEQSSQETEQANENDESTTRVEDSDFNGEEKEGRCTEYGIKNISVGDEIRKIF